MRAVVALLLLSSLAQAERRTYVVAIGNNAAPEGLPQLRYADDDAAAVYSFAREVGSDATLLTVLDADSQRRFPELSGAARPPSLSELRDLVGRLRAKFAADRERGDDPALLLFFSGHGTRGGDGPPALTFLDGGLTREILYDEILAILPARHVHLFVDACHAEAIIRPRDSEGAVVSVTAEDVRAYAERSTLARFPHVGAIIATASAAQAHEWDEYQRGVFSHQILSGLRGAADVNGDGLVEYSELYSFVAAANREVADPRARLEVVVRPPPLDRRAALIDLRAARTRLSGRAGALYIEDARGNRLADLHAESTLQWSLVLPPGRVYVRRGGEETSVELQAGMGVRLEQLKLARATTRPRGAVELSLHEGLFATPYGPNYYRGFVDRDPELMAVPLIMPPPESTSPTRMRKLGWGLIGTGVGLGVAGALFAGLAAGAAADFHAGDFERSSIETNRRFVAFEATSIVSFVVAAASVTVGAVLATRRPKSRFARLGSGLSLTW